MSKHGRQAMAVRPQELETPERGLSLVNRGPAGSQAEPEEPTAEDELRALGERIAEARRVEPAGKDLHCRDCFHRGRDAAVRVIEGR